MVGDNPERVRQAVDIAKRRADIIITTGGLGPTCDDLTKVALAEAFGRELVSTMSRAPSASGTASPAMGRPMTENNYQQAMIPEGGHRAGQRLGHRPRRAPSPPTGST